MHYLGWFHLSWGSQHSGYSPPLSPWQSKECGLLGLIQMRKLICPNHMIHDPSVWMPTVFTSLVWWKMKPFFGLSMKAKWVRKMIQLPPRMGKGRGQKLATTDSLTPTLVPDADIDAVHWHMDLILDTLPSLVIIIDQVTIWPQVKPILLPTLQNSTWKKWKGWLWAKKSKDFIL